MPGLDAGGHREVVAQIGRVVQVGRQWRREANQAQSGYRHTDIDAGIPAGRLRHRVRDDGLRIVAEALHVGACRVPAVTLRDRFERRPGGEVSGDIEGALVVEALGEWVRRAPGVDEWVEPLST